MIPEDSPPALSAPTLQDTSRKRCLSCERWGGTRRPGPQPATVEYDADNDKGLCREGPWHGSLRGARNACGQWILWHALEPEAK